MSGSLPTAEPLERATTTTNASLTSHLVADHVRLGVLLDEAGVGGLGAYHAFRVGLLRHIGIEEKILLPLLRGAGRSFVHAEQLRLDHAALVAMLVPPPTRALLGRLRALLALHDPLEESPEGLYRLADDVLDVPRVLERIRATATPPLAPNRDDVRAYAAIEELLQRAGRKPAV